MDISAHPFSFRFPWENMASVSNSGDTDDLKRRRQRRRDVGSSSMSASGTPQHHPDTADRRDQRRSGISSRSRATSSHVVESLEAAKKELLGSQFKGQSGNDDRSDVASVAATVAGFGHTTRRSKRRSERYSVGIPLSQLSIGPTERQRRRSSDLYSYITVGSETNGGRHKSASHFGGNDRSVPPSRPHSQRLDPKYSYGPGVSLLPPSLQRSDDSNPHRRAQSYVGERTIYERMLPSARSKIQESRRQNLILPESEPRTASRVVQDWLLGGGNSRPNKSGQTKTKSRTENYSYIQDRHDEISREQGGRTRRYAPGLTIAEEPDDGLNEWGLPRLLVATKYDDEVEEEEGEEYFEQDHIVDSYFLKENKDTSPKPQHNSKENGHAPRIPNCKHASRRDQEKLRYSNSGTTVVNISPQEPVVAEESAPRPRRVTIRTLQKFLAMAYTLCLVCGKFRVLLRSERRTIQIVSVVWGCKKVQSGWLNRVRTSRAAARTEASYTAKGRESTTDTAKDTVVAKQDPSLKLSPTTAIQVSEKTSGSSTSSFQETNSQPPPKLGSPISIHPSESSFSNIPAVNVAPSVKLTQPPRPKIITSGNTTNSKIPNSKSMQTIAVAAPSTLKASASSQSLSTSTRLRQSISSKSLVTPTPSPKVSITTNKTDRGVVKRALQRVRASSSPNSINSTTTAASPVTPIKPTASRCINVKSTPTSQKSPSSTIRSPTTDALRPTQPQASVSTAAVTTTAAVVSAVQPRVASRTRGSGSTTNVSMPKSELSARPMPKPEPISFQTRRKPKPVNAAPSPATNSRTKAEVSPSPGRERRNSIVVKVKKISAKLGGEGGGGN